MVVSFASDSKRGLLTACYSWCSLFILWLNCYYFLSVIILSTLKSIAITFFWNRIILSKYLGNIFYSKDNIPEHPWVGKHYLRKIDIGMCDMYELFLKLILG
jgi:cellulose synthase/poly-beta-1,6-N-acetylglucosamine synthase-like glycosyltransferase